MFRPLKGHLQALVIEIQAYEYLHLDLYYEGLKMTRQWSKHVAPILQSFYECYLRLLCLTGVSFILICVSCSLILKMKLVLPSLPRSSYVPSSLWFIL